MDFNLSSPLKITPEVNMTEKLFYLIRIDGEEAAIVDTYDNVKLVIDSLAASEENRLKKEGYSDVFRQDLENGHKVIISTQGRWFGAMHSKVQIDYKPVGEAILIKGRHEKPQKNNNRVYLSTSTPSTPSSVPPPPPPLPQSSETEKTDYQKKIITTIKNWGKPIVNTQFVNLEHDSSDDEWIE